MNCKKLVFILTFFILLGCKNEVPLFFSSESFTETSLDLCQDVGCPEVTINYVTTVGDEDVSNKINKTVNQYIIDALYLGEGTSDAQTISEAAASFIEMYRIHNAEFPDMAAEYFADISVSESYSSEGISSFELRTYMYTGGAHGYGATTFMNINPKTGDTLTSEEIFKNIAKFTEFAETKFKKAHNIPKDGAINSTGFWFENDTFYLPENLGFTTENIILHYNAYDIASYADGPIELEIPMEEAAKYLDLN